MKENKTYGFTRSRVPGQSYDHYYASTMIPMVSHRKFSCDAKGCTGNKMITGVEFFHDPKAKKSWVEISVWCTNLACKHPDGQTRKERYDLRRKYGDGVKTAEASKTDESGVEEPEPEEKKEEKKKKSKKAKEKPKRKAPSKVPKVVKEPPAPHQELVAIAKKASKKLPSDSKK